MSRNMALFTLVARTLCLLGVLSSTNWLTAGDWTQWGGKNQRNMASDEKGLPEGFEPGQKRPDGTGIDPATTKNVRWAARLGSQTYGNPTIGEGKVFVGTNDFGLKDPRYKSTRGGIVKCFDEASGKLLWQWVVPRRFDMPWPRALFNHLNLGVCTSPTVEDGRIYLVTSRCELVCLDADGMADGNDGPFVDEGRYSIGDEHGRRKDEPIELLPTDGDIIWMLDMVTELPVCPHDAANGAPLIDGNVLYVPTSNGMDNSHDRMFFPEGPSLIAVDKRTGKLLAVDDLDLGNRLFHAQWSSPSMGMVNGKKQLFVGGADGVCYGLEALDGVPELGPDDEPVKLKTVWSCDTNPPEYKYKDGKLIPYRCGDKRVRRAGIVNRDDGTYVGPNEIIATPVYYNGRIYVANGQDPHHGNGKAILTCIDPSGTGDITDSGKVWTYRDMQRTMSTVSVADGLVYVADVVGTLHCLDADSGRPYWTHETKEEVWGATLVADNKIYLGTERLFWIFAAGKEKRLIDRIRLGSPVWCTPVAANGALYVASQRYLWVAEEE